MLEKLKNFAKLVWSYRPRIVFSEQPIRESKLSDDEIQAIIEQYIKDYSDLDKEPTDGELKAIENEKMDSKFLVILNCSEENDMNLYLDWDREKETDKLADEMGLFLYLVTSGAFRQNFINILAKEVERNPMFFTKVAKSWEEHQSQFEGLPEITPRDVFNQSLKGI